MKNRFRIASYILLFIICIIAAISVNNSYSLTCNSAYANIENVNGTYTVNYYCQDVNTNDTYKISADDAINKFGVSRYQSGWYDGKMLYFNKTNQISQSEFENGIAAEDADNRLLAYGDAGIRIHSTQEGKNQIDALYNNKKLGEYHFVFSSREGVSVKELYNYYFTKYGVSTTDQNYYRYSLKGEFEPIRFRADNQVLESDQQIGEFVINTYEVTSNYAPIRISKEQIQYTEKFINNLIPILSNGARNDAEKVYRAAKYIHDNTQYFDETYHQALIEGQTSIYNAFIQRRSVCIGFSIAFSYLMDKMGIESYIVDMNSVSGNSYSSSHTYNIVKIDGKMYQVDVTSGYSINALTGRLSSNNFNKATSNYNTSGFTDYDHNAANNVWRNYPQINNTFNYVTPNGYIPGQGGNINVDGSKVDYTVTTTTSTTINNNYDPTTSTNNITTSYQTITNDRGEVVGTSVITNTIPVHHTSTITNEKGKTQIITYDEDGNVLGVIENNDIKKENKKLITNCLIIVAITLVIILIILKIYNLKTTTTINMKDL